jgi:hypothetical protein
VQALLQDAHLFGSFSASIFLVCQLPALPLAAALEERTGVQVVRDFDHFSFSDVGDQTKDDKRRVTVLLDANVLRSVMRVVSSAGVGGPSSRTSRRMATSPHPATGLLQTDIILSLRLHTS